jgi:hypothetical protein
MIDDQTEYIDSEKTVNHRCVANYQFPSSDSQKRSVILLQGTDPSSRRGLLRDRNFERGAPYVFEAVDLKPRADDKKLLGHISSCCARLLIWRKFDTGG